MNAIKIRNMIKIKNYKGRTLTINKTYKRINDYWTRDGTERLEWFT